jgi:hypothetical protein
LIWRYKPDAAFPRHQHIQNHQIGLLTLDQPHAFFAIGGFHGCIAVLFQTAMLNRRTSGSSSTTRTFFFMYILLDAICYRYRSFGVCPCVLLPRKSDLRPTRNNPMLAQDLGTRFLCGRPAGRRAFEW